MTEKLAAARLLSVMVPYSVDVMADGLVQENAAGVVVMVVLVGVVGDASVPQFAPSQPSISATCRKAARP